MSNTVGIVGAGFSGAVLAAHLLRRAPAQGLDIVLIERTPTIGRGVAYAAREFPYLLNVPAERLSADSRDPLQFLRFAKTRLPQAEGADFLPRALYGDYLEDMLLQAERAAPRNVRLTRVAGEVTNVLRMQGAKPLAAQFAGRAPIPADSIVLAVGNPPPPLLPWAEEVRNHSAYRQDPWDLPKHLDAGSRVLIVGNGLTMADAAAALSDVADRVPQMQTISRRGLLPHAQTNFRAGAVRGDGVAMFESAHSVRELLKVSRTMASEVGKLGGDWREVITFIRHLAPRLWARLPEAEQRRFVRHLQAHWDVHRHRLPPQLAERLAQLRSSGRLQVNAGRIQRAAAAGAQLSVSWQPRGAAATRTLTVDLVINATGPNYAISSGNVPLLGALRAAGLISADALHLGVRTADHGACVDAAGRASDALFYLGPMLRAGHWEATAATELRDHAEALAAHLTSSTYRG
jgi:uncharacterized NAD(P)/FAD-binding protein YdhS